MHGTRLTYYSGHPADGSDSGVCRVQLDARHHGSSRRQSPQDWAGQQLLPNLSCNLQLL